METEEYLVAFGQSGDFGRFRAAASLRPQRGERVVVRGPRGVEIAEVLRPAAPGHAHFLPNTTVGQLLRRLTEDDERNERALRLRGQQLFERGQRLIEELKLPLVLLDVEVLLDGEHAVLHHLRDADAEVRAFVSTLSREFALHIALVDMSGPRSLEEEESAEPLGCGRPHCGQGEDGGCGSCGSGGCGSCGAAKPQEDELHFAELRERMEHPRTALL